MNSFLNKMEKYFVPIAGKLGSQRHLVAIRDGFVSIMPLVIAGAFAVLINGLPIPVYQKFMASVFGETWTVFGGNIWTASFAIMSLLVVITISYHLAKSYDADGVIAAVMALGSLIMLTNPTEDGSGIPFKWAGGTGLFVAIIVALVVTEIFVKFSKSEKLIIKMPDGVPPAVSKSFAALFPVMITVAVISMIKVLLGLVGITDIQALIYDVLQKPLAGVANTLGSAIAIVLFNHIAWFFGLHGSNILEPVMQAIYLPALDANIKAFQTGAAIPNIVTKPFFDCFVYMGGSGVTICLIGAIFIASYRRKSKNKAYQSMANISAAPGIFNINEPIIYGLPIVLNPIFLVPFILAPLVLTIISYLAIASGIVPPTVAMVPWITPPIISGWLVTGGSLMGVLLQIINLTIGLLIYYPFIIMAERIDAKKSLTNTAKIENSKDKKLEI
ncbi:PTS sugar transporter subunit IIC [Clostridium senegalense]|uniref:Permease IIC component n=1 Tax=Clostridium senegalense TaxID=1465809 RepID=A0A6M0H352_9CLOT|nr:PTS sugar transporter subunit IIC [Clostridium senegalense]NEU05145.1 PTS sugar transporter subunit IIC [Clostridium senegalense]